MLVQCVPFLDKHPYRVIYAALVGSRGYGYGGITSDYDVRGIHLLPGTHILGFEPDHDDTVELKEPPIDLATHDLKKFLLLLSKSNCGVLEVLYSPQVIITCDLMQTLREVGKKCITRQVAECYKRMAENQQHRMKEAVAKSLMHSYRCLLMGIHAMRTGEIYLDMPELAKLYDQPGWNYLYSTLVYKAPVENVARHVKDIEALKIQLEEAKAASKLPVQVDMSVKKQLEEILVTCRRGYI